MKWIPVWVGEIYLELLKKFGMDRFTNRDAKKALPQIRGNTIDRALSIMKDKGWAFKARRGLWYLALLNPPIREKKKRPPSFTKLLAQVRRKLEGKVRGAILFGSYALGTHDDYSDIDVLVIVQRRTEELSKISDMFLNKHVVLHVYTHREIDVKSPLFWGLAFGHEIIYETNGCASSLINKIKKYTSDKKIRPLFFTRNPVFYVGSQSERERLERLYRGVAEKLRRKKYAEGIKLNLLKTGFIKKGYEVPIGMAEKFTKLAS